MSDYRGVYRDHPERYDELVRAEDVENSLFATLQGLGTLTGADAVEVGAGTGRITRMLLESGARTVLATEIQPAMLAVAQTSLAAYRDRVRFAVADARALPAGDATADFCIAGWVFGHFRSWMPTDWKDAIGAAVDELERVARSGGTVVIVETLGTGYQTPHPSEGLAEYYRWLEGERGFRRQTIRTDYRFDSVADAARVSGFFFGEAFAQRVLEQQWLRVPECTGVWSRIRE